MIGQGPVNIKQFKQLSRRGGQMKADAGLHGLGL